MNVVEEVMHRGVSIKIAVDEDPSSPRDWDNLGVMFCSHRRYSLGDEQFRGDDYNGWDEVEAYLEKERDAAIILPLYMMDHSGITIRTTPFGDPWDSGRIGFIFATAEAIRKAFMVKRITPKVHEQAIESLRAEVASYSSYVEGDVYGYVVDDDGPDEESCWGFIGEADYCLTEAKSVADFIADRREALDRAATDTMLVAAGGIH